MARLQRAGRTTEGGSLDLPATSLQTSDRIYFLHGAGELAVSASISSGNARVTVPSGLGSGMFQARRGATRGNGVAVNVVPGPKPPAAPTNVAARSLSPSQIRVSWTDASSNETGFRVTDGVSTWSRSANTTSFVVGGLGPGTYKCFMVQSYNSVGSSPWAPSSWTCTTTPR